MNVRFTTALTADTTFIWTALPPRNLGTSVLLLTGSKAALLHPCYPGRAATPGLGLPPPPFQMADGMAASLSPRTVAPASGTKRGSLTHFLTATRCLRCFTACLVRFLLSFTKNCLPALPPTPTTGQFNSKTTLRAPRWGQLCGPAQKTSPPS